MKLLSGPNHTTDPHSWPRHLKRGRLLLDPQVSAGGKEKTLARSPPQRKVPKTKEIVEDKHRTTTTWKIVEPECIPLRARVDNRTARYYIVTQGISDCQGSSAIPWGKCNRGSAVGMGGGEVGCQPRRGSSAVIE